MDARGPLFIVEVDTCEGSYGDGIIVTRNFQKSETARLYCIGRRGEDGVIRFIDGNYRSAEEARDAWPQAS